MSSMGWKPALGIVLLLALTGLVLLMTIALLQPPTKDLVALATFLLASGGATVLLGLASTRLGLHRWVKSLGSRLVFVSGLTATLVLVNVGFTAGLMFISPHDLALLSGLLVFSMGISVFVAFSYAEPITRSVEELMKTVVQMNAESLDTRVPVQSRDDVGKLAAAFNSMARQLESSFARERELEQARRELVTAVSHDLRTPLASIRAMLESIDDGVVTDPETVGRYTRTTLIEVENLSRLVTDLFELSQLEAGVLELHMESASLQDLVSDTLEGMSAQATARQLSLHGAVDEELLPLNMDTRRVQRVLYNLVQNAIRHTPPDGTIDIRARDTGSDVQVEVSDSGEGIAEPELQRLFERSYRADSSRSRASGGAGLGLSIAKGIVEAHGGRIWADSILGKGSVFSFTLPKVQPVSTG